MFKILVFLNFFLLLNFLKFISPEKIFADESFFVDAKIEYKFSEEGKANVTNTITIQNKEDYLYAQSFVFTISGLNPQNIKAFEGGVKLPLFRETKDGETILKINFPEPMVRKKTLRTLVITYEDNSLASKRGDVWEIVIPRLSNPEEFRKYLIELNVPKTFGDEAFLFPEASRLNKDGRISYFFEKDDLKNSTISLVFGKSQFYSFSLTYHLKNSSFLPGEVQIAIPPDTSYQKVYIQKIDPAPKNVFADEDGNWMASYRLMPRLKKDVKVEGVIQVFAKPLKITPNTSVPSFNLNQTQYWQTGDPEIKRISSKLKNPEEIYYYVINALSYDYNRVSPDTQRLGAIEALRNPTKATCTEFTDLFIALARASGIPAREINGFAYSENPNLQPLSLVTNVLHSWPEYWDETKSTWVAVDPTWGATANTDYFEKFDLKHITFVIHGKDPVLPNAPGTYKFGDDPKNDILVEIGKVPEKPKENIQINIRPVNILPFFKQTFKITIQNIGNTAFYNLETSVNINDKLLSSFSHQIVPPFAKIEKQIDVPTGFLASKFPDRLGVNTYKSEFYLPLDKKSIIFSQLLGILLILFIILSFIFIIYISKKRFFLKSLKIKA